jgi:gamma-glutamyltranspeptidase/glutathione hydrolase
MASCDAIPKPAFCSAVRGDRAEGWLAQSRSEAMAPHGMVVASQPLAAQAGLAVLQQGGNAIDAAVATAAVLTVVEPMMVGVGGDLFAIIYVAKEKKLYALNASGMAPSGATIAHFGELGYHADPANWGPGSGMPGGGILPVTVPGTVWGWDAVLKRFGTKTFKDVLAPAVDYAANGFPVSERISRDWILPPALPLRGCCSERDPDSVKTWYVGGRPPVAGQRFRNPDLARTFTLLQQQGADVFYRGEIAKAIVAKSTAMGGTMTLDDLAAYKGQWVEPASSAYHGVDVFELPPPSQAWATNEILNVLDTDVRADGARSDAREAQGPGPNTGTSSSKRKSWLRGSLQIQRRSGCVAPCLCAPAVDHARRRCGKSIRIERLRRGPKGKSDGNGGDRAVGGRGDGNMVSWVNSNFDEFGSGITFRLRVHSSRNRGALFSLDPKKPERHRAAQARATRSPPVS